MARVLPVLAIGFGGILVLIGPVTRNKILQGAAEAGVWSAGQIAAGIVGVGLILLGISLVFGLVRTLFTGLGIVAAGGVLLILTGVLH